MYFFFPVILEVIPHQYMGVCVILFDSSQYSNLWCHHYLLYLFLTDEHLDDRHKADCDICGGI